MAIEYRKRGSDDGTAQSDVVMTACPFCDEELGENVGFARHVGDCPEVARDD